MEKKQFRKEFGEQIRRDLKNIQDLKDDISEARELGRMDCVARLQKDIRNIHDGIVAYASAYLGIDDPSEAYKAAIVIVSDDEVNAKSIKDIRERTGLSQARFATRYGIPKRTIENWETDARKAPDYVIKLLARVVWEDFPNKIT